jgi:hypothetical protein
MVEGRKLKALEVPLRTRNQVHRSITDKDAAQAYPEAPTSDGKGRRERHMIHHDAEYFWLRCTCHRGIQDYSSVLGSFGESVVEHIMVKHLLNRVG